MYDVCIHQLTVVLFLQPATIFPLTCEYLSLNLRRRFPSPATLPFTCEDGPEILVSLNLRIKTNPKTQQTPL